jgi:O-antigen/teichoic acid export membrane protein
MLTEKWAPTIPYLQLLCMAGLLFPLHVMNLNVLQALGRSDLFLRLEIIKKGMVAINIAVTWRWGITAMIYGMIVTSIIAYYMNSYYNGVLIRYPIREQVHDLLPYLAVSVLMGMAVYAAKLLHFSNQWSLLVVQIATGITVYAGLCRAFRLKAFMDTWHAMRDKIRPAGISVSGIQGYK